MMRKNLPTFLVALLAITLIGYAAGAFWAVRRNPKLSGCPRARPEEPLNRDEVTQEPKVDQQDGRRSTDSQALGPVPTGGLFERLCELAKIHAPKLEPWDAVRPSLALSELYYRRRPEVLRDETGRVVGYTYTSLEQLMDTPLADEMGLDLGPREPWREALDNIDAVLEAISKLPPGESRQALMAYLRDYRETGDSGQDNFLRAGRTRVILALRDTQPDPQDL